MHLSLTVFEVTCWCTGVVLHNPSAYLCALYEPQGTIAVHRSQIKRLPYTSVCLVWGSGPHSCAPESDQTTLVHMNPSLTVFDVTCRCTGVPSNVPCARVSFPLCLVLVSWLGNRAGLWEPCIGVLLLHSRAHLCALCGVQDRMSVHRSHAKLPPCTRIPLGGPLR